MIFERFLMALWFVRSSFVL